MKAADLKVGDLVKINNNLPTYPTLPKETVRVWKKLAKRGTPVRIKYIDEWGSPWYCCRFKRKNGTWEKHYLSVMDADANWTVIK
jgi:hypothetical protein